jgi:predicted RNase H-like HicB family nuclease
LIPGSESDRSAQIVISQLLSHPDRKIHGGYSVVVPEIDGCVTQGETIEEVEHMTKELAETLLDMRHDERREAVRRLHTDPLDSEIGT